MQRDLGLTAAEAKARVADESQVARTERKLRKDLGSAFGGAWYDAGTSRLVVGVTDSSKAAEVRAAGADARQVSRSVYQLDALKAKLDAAKASAPQTVPGWYVDVVTNKIVIQSNGDAVAEGLAFAKGAGLPADAFSVQESNEAPRPLINVVGGNAYYIGGSRCSVGFSVNGGFVSAGHCGTAGSTTSQPSGTFAGSSFLGNDYSYIQTGTDDNPIGAVNNYAGGHGGGSRITGLLGRLVDLPIGFDDGLALRNHPGTQLDGELRRRQRQRPHPDQRMCCAGRLGWIGNFG